MWKVCLCLWILENIWIEAFCLNIFNYFTFFLLLVQLTFYWFYFFCTDSVIHLCIAVGLIDAAAEHRTEYGNGWSDILVKNPLTGWAGAQWYRTCEWGDSVPRNAALSRQKYNLGKCFKDGEGFAGLFLWKIQSWCNSRIAKSKDCHVFWTKYLHLPGESISSLVGCEPCRGHPAWETPQVPPPVSTLDQQLPSKPWPAPEPGLKVQKTQMGHP